MIYKIEGLPGRNQRQQAICQAIFLLLLCLGITNAHAQEYPLDKIREAEAAFPTSDAVKLLKSERVKIWYDKGQLQLTTQVEEQIYIRQVGPATPRAAEIVIAPEFESLQDVTVYTVIPNPKRPDKTLVQMQDVTKFGSRDVMMSSIFFTGYKGREIPYLNLQPGAVVVLKYTKRYKYPQVLDNFFFKDEQPVLDARLEVVTSPNVEMAFRLFGRDTTGITYRATESEGAKNYYYTAKALAVYPRDPNGPGSLYIQPHLNYYPKHVAGLSAKQPLLNGIQELYNWKYGLAERRNRQGGDELQAITTKLVEGAQSAAEKAEKIFQWVQSNIKYIAFEDGWKGFVPTGPAEVCNLRYGDCKGMASILVEMLSFAGLEAHITWIGTRTLPYRYSALPTPHASNHMIAALKLDGKTIFLDATDSYLPFGLPTQMIQGKDALVSIDSVKYEVIPVLVVPAEENRYDENITVKINNTDVEGNGMATMVGYEAGDFRGAYLSQPDANRQGFLQGFFQKGKGQFEIKMIEIAGVDDNRNTVQATYEYKVPGYVRKAGNALYLNMHLTKPFANRTLPADRRDTYIFENRVVFADTFKLEVPEGYAVSYLPESVELTHNKWAFELKYTQDAGTVLLTRLLKLDTLQLEPEDFADWNTFMAVLNKAYGQTLVLKTK